MIIGRHAVNADENAYDISHCRTTRRPRMPKGVAHAETLPDMGIGQSGEFVHR